MTLLFWTLFPDCVPLFHFFVKDEPNSLSFRLGANIHVQKEIWHFGVRDQATLLLTVPKIAV